MQIIGKIDARIYEDEFGKLQSDEVILTHERDIHIQLRHKQDYPFFIKYGSETINDPDIILVDGKHEATVMLIKKVPEANLNVVIRLALETDNTAYKNSVMTFHRVRDSNLNKILKKNKVLYIRKQC